MITLADIITQISDSLAEHARWNAAVKTLALSEAGAHTVIEIAAAHGIALHRDDQTPVPVAMLRQMIVARLDGCERELQALHKIHHDLISNGRAETPSDAPQANSSHMTPPAISAASE